MHLRVSFDLFFFIVTLLIASGQVQFNDKDDTDKAIHLSYLACTIMNKVLPVYFLKFP